MDTHPRAHETHSSSYKKQAMDPTIPKPTTTMDDPGLVHDGAAATATTPPLEEAEAEPNRIPVVPVQSTDPNHPHNDNTTTNNTTNNTATVVEVTRVVSATDIGLAVVDPFALVTVVVEASSSSSVPASSASSSSSVAAAAAATESVVSETNATTTAVDDNYNTNSDDTEEDDATESEEEASSFLGCERLLGAREPNENGSVAVNSCMEEASASSQHPPEPTATVAAATTTTAVDDENEYDDTAPPIPLSTTNATIATIATREDGGAVEVEGAGEETAAVEETVDVSSSPPPPHAAAEPASLVAPPPPTAVSTSTTPVQDETLEPEETLPPPARGVIRMEEVGGDGKNSVEATTTSDPPPPLPGVGEPHLPPSPPQSEPALPPLLRNAINIAIIQETRKEHPLLEVGVAEEEGTGGETAAVEEEEDAASKQPPLSGTEPAPVPPVEEDAPVGNSMEVSSSDQPPLSGVEPELRPVANILPPHAERAPAAPLQKEATATTPVDETVKKDTDTSGRGVLIEGGGGAGDSVKKEVAPSNQPPLPVAEPAPDPAVEEEDAFGIAIATAADLPATPPSKQQERSIDSVTTDDDKNKNENDNQSLEGRKQKTRSCIDSTPTAAGNALVDTAPNHHEQEHERLPQAPLLEPTAMHAAASAVDALPRTTDPSETDDDKDRNPLMKAAIATTATIAVSQNSKVSSKRKQLPAGVEHTLPPPPRDTNPVEEPKINEDSERQRSVVDVHFITDTILAAASTCSSTGNQQNKRRVAGRNCPRALLDRLNQDARTMLAPKMMFHLSDTVPDNDDCDPNERGGSNASSTCRIWDHQIVHIPWQPQSQHSGKQNTTGCHFEAPPNVATLIRVCYSLSAWLEATHTHHTAAAATEVESMASSMPSSSSHHHHHNNSKTHPIAIVTCDNGQTRTTLAIACFLKFAGIVETCRAGFCHVVERRRRRQTSPSTTAFSAPYSPEAIYQALPPSIHTVFRNFDTAVDLGAYLNRKALWLDAIALQGVPVEDRPCLDVWDGTGQHVYSSDPHVWNENSPTTIESLQQSNIHDSRHSPLKPAEMSSPTLSRQMATSSQWVDEEGFFRVNCLLQGDFYIVCRFGGAHASGVLDPSKIIFRYANSTAFMGAASPYELSSSQVDIQRRYDRHIDPNDFMISLMFDAHWTLASSSTPGEAEKSLLRRDCPASILPEILSGKQAMEAGWHEIVKHHVVKPVKKNIDSLIAESLGELDGCPRHIISLSLQLANFDSTMAQTMLLEGRLRSWWQIELQPEDDESMMAAKSNGCPPRARATNIFDSLPVLTEAQTLDKVRLLLESTNLKQRNSGPRDFLLERVRQQASRTTVSAESQGVGLKDSHPSKLTGLYYTSPIMTPNPGDVVSALNSSRISTLLRGKSTPRDHPLLPMIPKRRKRSNTLPIEDPDNDSALDFLLKLNHPGVDLQDLLYVSKTIRSLHSRETPDQSITANGTASNPPNDQDPEETTDVLPVTNNQIPSEESSGLSGPTAETLVMTKSQNSGHMASTAAAAAMAKRLRPGALIAITSEIRLKGDMKIKSKTSMLSASAEAVTASLSKHETAGSSDGETVATAEMARRLNPAEEISPVADEPQRTGDAEVPLKEDPKYQKYFKMLKVGLPDGAVRNAMQRDDLDGSILDLDPSKSLKSQRTKAISPEASFDDDVPIKDDPVFQIYFKMLQMGLPDGAVRNAMARDGVDASALDLDKEKSFKSQTLSIDAVEDSGIPIKDDPAFQKYFKMMKMGLPEGAIRNAMARDGLDASVLDLDPNKSLRSQIKSDEVKDDGIPIKDDPNFQKYFKMLKMGLPHGAVRNAMDRDGADASILDLDPEKSLKSQRNGPSTVDAVDEDIPIRDDPAFQKYFKMVKMGLPEGAVRNAMDRDGVDSTVLDLDPTKSLQFQRNVLPDEDDGVPLKDDPEWSKYFKMLQMGLPLGAVKNAVERDGKQGSVLDLDPTKSIASQLKTPGKSRMVPKKKKRVRRKKIYWNPLNSGQIKANSLWSTVKGRLQMSQLKYDEKEFADLFTESADPADKKNKPEKQDTSKAKKPQQVIDGKRSMNGGIILARLKVNYKSIAEMVDNMQSEKLDATSLKALKEMLPSADEKAGLLAYMAKCGNSEEMKLAAYTDFSECEKYMFTMLDVADASAKFDCMLYRSQFKVRYDELMSSIGLIEKACDEVRDSDRLQTIMVMILTLVNEINTGGDGNEAAGFTLDALLKLNEAKAFDKKTSVLHYLVKLMKRNDDSLLAVRDDLSHVKDAELVVLDSLVADMKALKEEIEPIRLTVTAQAERLQEAGQLVQMSLKELAEQKTSVRTVASVPQYNKIDHHTGRTPMERFAINASFQIDDAILISDKVKEKFERLLEYFGEDGNMASNDFFGTFNAFLADFGKAVETVNKEDKAKEKEEAKRAKADAQKQLSLSLKKDKISDSSDSKNDPKAAAAANIHPLSTLESTLADGAMGIGAVATMSPGIAAMAAAAAARKRSSVKVFDDGDRENLTAGEQLLPGSNATNKNESDEARKTKSTATNTKSDEEGPRLPGIATMAAAAGARKNTKSEQEGPRLPGIAAMAAAAGARKNTKSEQEGPRLSGIAAMAAAAGARKNTKSEQEGPRLSGIAAMAAAASARKNTKSEEEDLPLSGIAAMASVAAAAAAKNAKIEEEMPPLSDIAAMAAAAAEAKRKATEVVPSMSGIAAMAAAAAAAKNTKSEEKGPPLSGIAAMAAAAAAIKRKATEVVPSMSGIAAMAAAAAARKNSKSEEEGESPLSGIAAMAAAAAVAKRKATEDFPSMSGIAAMAAAAAAAKNRKNEEEGPPLSGIASMAAAAAVAKRNDTTEVVPSVSEIAATAEAAAAANNIKSEEEGPPSSGIASMAVAAATDHTGPIITEHTTVSAKSIATGDLQLVSGIDAMVAASAAAKVRRIAVAVSAKSEPMDNIPYQSDATNLRKAKQSEKNDMQPMTLEMEPTTTSDVVSSTETSRPHKEEKSFAPYIVPNEVSAESQNIVPDLSEVSPLLADTESESALTNNIGETFSFEETLLGPMRKTNMESTNDESAPFYALPVRPKNQLSEWIAAVHLATAAFGESLCSAAAEHNESDSSMDDDFWVGDRPPPKKDQQAEWLAAITVSIQKHTAL